MKPTYEELVAFARWAQQKQPDALRIMQENHIKIKDLKDPMEKLAFTFYTDLVEIADEVEELFGEK